MFNPFLLIARSNNQTPTLTESFLFKPCIIYYPQGDLNYSINEAMGRDI